ncbi:MAG: hypothetical protein GAK33_01957 [Burkholderia lata]|uniref:Transposon Tn7 transposition protein TnsD C-terminal domain-containing protein n=1 Tax=Burkholderia lata (strain ATCC 17760 / DSM 23089 / LMG 22485 / NCIMB 9086 / R18194 / 383) TaxID=482957 RepID=A0A833PXB0_BURL3|nr:TnsD family Tn7-like transposition protein [Burkholderia lata]KAF1038621.1 MAG: hypothetical protein GAK33_01957 [Burkholderia lata]
MKSLIFFPALPRETATSIASMVAQTTSSKEAREVSRAGNRRGLLLYSTLPCRAERFCEFTQNAYGDAMDVVAKHTLLSYSTCGMSSKMAEAATRNIAFGIASRTMFPRLLPGFESGNRFGLQCPECAIQVSGGHTRRVSFCAHCIPYVTRCPWHGCRLICDRECSTLEMLLSRAGDHARTENSLRYAQLSCSVSEVMPREPLWPKIVGLLREKGYVTEHGALRMAQLHSAFRKLFSAGFEDDRLTHFVSDMNTLDLCIQAARRSDHAAPAPILVLLYCAACDVDTFAQSPAPQSPERPTSDVDAEWRERARAQWAMHVSEHPEMTRTQLRKSMPAVWAWLHRHDDEWLRVNQLPSRRPRGGRHNHDIPPFVEYAISGSQVDRREHTGGREPLPSAYQFRIAYGMDGFLFSRVTSMPAAIGTEAHLPGRKELFVRRRVRLAIEQLKRQRKPLGIATVARSARLRISTVRTFSFNMES